MKVATFLWTLLALILCNCTAVLARQAEHVLRFDLALIGTSAIDTVPLQSDSPPSEIREVPLGLPLTVRLSLRNVSENQAVQVPDIDPKLGHVTFEIGEVGAPSVPLSVYAWESSGDHLPAVRTLEPGGSIVWETFLFGQLSPSKTEGQTELMHAYIVDQAGQYRIRARIDLERPQKLHITSNEIEVEISESDEAWSLLTEAGLVESVERLRAGADVPEERVDRALTALESPPVRDAHLGAFQRAFGPWLRRHHPAPQHETTPDPGTPAESPR